MTIISLLSCVLVYAEASGVPEGGQKSQPAAQAVTTEAAPGVAETRAETDDTTGDDSAVRMETISEPTPAGTEKPAATGTVAADSPETPGDGQNDGGTGADKLPEKSPPDPIAMESDQATINREQRIIDLVGNVKVSQGATVISANRLILTLKEGAKLETPNKSGGDSIETVVATGDVKFQLDIGTAYSDRAEYNTATKLLVLTGKEPKFVSGENTITGSRIIVNRESGMVRFEGGVKSRVEAVIYSNEQL